MRGEDFAKPPEWSDEVNGVFFEDARKALSGEPPPGESDDKLSVVKSQSLDDQSGANWQDLIDADTLTSEVKQITNRLALLVRKSQSNVISYEEFRRELTMLAMLFSVIREYPGDVSWKSSAGSMEQSCLCAAASCAQKGSLAAVYDTFVKLQELLSGQSSVENEPPAENLTPEFAPLMQWMKLIAEDGLPVALSKKADFRRKADSIAQSAQLLAMLSEVIRGEEYGYAADATYQGHADKLRDAARQLNAAATAEEFDKAVQAAGAIQKSCADCHADFRG